MKFVDSCYVLLCLKNSCKYYFLYIFVIFAGEKNKIKSQIILKLHLNQLKLIIVNIRQQCLYIKNLFKN